MTNSTPNQYSLLSTGALLRLEGEVLADFNQIMCMGYKAEIDMMKARNQMLPELIQATVSAGLLQALGQEDSGAFQVAGGAMGLAGQTASIYGSCSEADELAGIKNAQGLEVNGEAVGQDGAAAADEEAPLVVQGDQERFDEIPDDEKKFSDAELALKNDQVNKKWAKYGSFGAMGQMVQQTMGGAGSLATAPMTAGAAKEQADEKMAETLLSSLGQLLSSAETAAQSAKSAFDQTTNLFTGTVQPNVIQATAH